MNVQTSADILPPAVSVSLKPQWVRVPDATKLYGLGRTTIYGLIAEGKIKSACIQKRGSLRGLRVLSTDSLDRYFEEVAAKQAEAAQK